MPPPEKDQKNDSSSPGRVLKPWENGYRFDLNGKDGAILTGDGQGANEAGAPSVLSQKAAAEEHLPKTTIEEKPEKAEPLASSFIDPTLRAFTARFGLLAVTGNLTSDNKAITQTLRKAGPMGSQLLGQLSEMEKLGWKLQPIGFNDRYLQLERPNLLTRATKMLTLSGYHYDTFKGESLRTIGYNNVSNLLGGVMGSSYGTGNPVRHTAAIVAHEIAHHDKSLVDYKDISRLTTAEQQTLAKRLLATETRAILTQLHVADKVGDLHLANDSLRAALMKRDLGGFIYDAWGKSSSTYKAFGSVDRSFAKTFVNDFIAELSTKTEGRFNSPLVDFKTGRVGVFDVTEGVGNRFGSIAGDEEMFKRMHAPAGEGAQTAGRFAAFMESKTGRVLGHGMKGAAAVGLIATAADLKSAYGESTQKGNARLARVGVDWAGFEAGSVVGARLGTALAVSSKVKLPVLAIPLAAMSLGIGGSYLADKHVGAGVESYLGRKSP